jgi:soluble lytic murein transglycosylase
LTDVLINRTNAFGNAAGLIDSLVFDRYSIRVFERCFMRYFLVIAQAVLFSGVLLPAVGSAQIYKYQDKDGVIHFTNVPTHGGFKLVLRDSGARGASLSTRADYDEAIRFAADRHSIDADLVRAVIKAESDFNANARSHKGAMGLMQLMPDTARLHNVLNAFDPIDNIEGGVRHLRMLLERYQGDLRLSLAAYNAGSGAVEKHGGIPPFAETREYVRRVLRFYEDFRGGRS